MHAWNRMILILACLLPGLWLALPAHAQLMSLQQLAQVTEGANNSKPVVFDPGKPAPVIVADAANHSAIAFDGMERAFTDALTDAVKNTGVFTPVDHTAVEAAVKALGFTLPFSPDAYAMIADRLQCAYVITSSIDSAKIEHSRKGSSAEVMVTVVVVSKAMRLPFTGVQIAACSVPQDSQSAPEELVREALTSAANQITQKLLALRIPCARLLTGCTMGGDLTLNGGSKIGLKKGMILITTRRGQPTGKMRVTQVYPDCLYAEVLEDSKGIAPGDKAIPARYEPPTRTRYRRTGLLAFLAVGALFVLAGSL